MVVGYELVGVSCGWWWDAAGWYHGLLGFVFFFGIYGRRWFSVVVTVSGMGWICSGGVSVPMGVVVCYRFFGFGS